MVPTGDAVVDDDDDVVDASDLVEVSIVRLCTNAPLLTAWCSFEQTPELRFCVIRDEEERCSFGVLERQHFEEALGQQRNALSHPIKMNEKHQDLTLFLGAWNGLRRRYFQMGEREN